MIAILDYGLGNVGSIQNMLKYLGIDSHITNDKSEISKADKLILPGVGSFDMGMMLLRQKGLDIIIQSNAVIDKKPILGICLGMQLLGEKSEEGTVSGLGLIPFRCVRFFFPDKSLKVPHMGWDYINIEKQDRIVNGLKGELRYYFVHSYYAVCANKEDILMSCNYGFSFSAAVSHDNIYGVQFHPEKSHNFGMALLNNFSKL